MHEACVSGIGMAPIMCGNLPMLIFLFAWVVGGLRYEPSQARFNLNQNKTATDPLDYWGEWSSHNYHPSPKNWRMPLYTIPLDRFADGDPANNDANGTVFEHSWMSNQYRFGGDAQGLRENLDYIQGMGIKESPWRICT